MDEIYFGKRVLQKSTSGSYFLVIPPIWIQNHELIVGEKVEFFSRNGELVVKVNRRLNEQPS